MRPLRILFALLTISVLGISFSASSQSNANGRSSDDELRRLEARYDTLSSLKYSNAYIAAEKRVLEAKIEKLRGLLVHDANSLPNQGKQQNNYLILKDSIVVPGSLKENIPKRIDAIYDRVSWEYDDGIDYDWFFDEDPSWIAKFYNGKKLCIRAEFSEFNDGWRATNITYYAPAFIVDKTGHKVSVNTSISDLKRLGFEYRPLLKGNGNIMEHRFIIKEQYHTITLSAPRDSDYITKIHVEYKPAEN